MPVFERPDAEIHYEVHGSGHPLLHDNRDPWDEAVSGFDWRGPTHLAESIRRVGDFLARHTPAS